MLKISYLLFLETYQPPKNFSYPSHILTSRIDLEKNRIIGCLRTDLTRKKVSMRLLKAYDELHYCDERERRL